MTQDPARQRFLIISLLRLMAMIFIAAGILALVGRMPGLDASMQKPLGIALAAIGLIDLVVLVPLLTRRWRSGDGNGPQ